MSRKLKNFLTDALNITFLVLTCVAVYFMLYGMVRYAVEVLV